MARRPAIPRRETTTAGVSFGPLSGWTSAITNTQVNTTSHKLFAWVCGDPYQRIRAVLANGPDLGFLSRDGGIRTHDLSVPNAARYQAAPRPD